MKFSERENIKRGTFTTKRGKKREKTKRLHQNYLYIRNVSTRVDIETYRLYFRICMRVFTYIAPAMRPGGSSNRITVKENQIMYTVKPIIYTSTYTYTYILLSFSKPNE